MLLALKGTVPKSIAYRTTPADHTSDWYPQYPLFSNTSGAMYAGVPHYSNISSLGFVISLETPKSHILTVPWDVSRMLSSLMSR